MVLSKSLQIWGVSTSFFHLFGEPIMDPIFKIDGVNALNKFRWRHLQGVRVLTKC